MQHNGNSMYVYSIAACSQQKASLVDPWTITIIHCQDDLRLTKLPKINQRYTQAVRQAVVENDATIRAVSGLPRQYIL